jgi:hypothetical protein
VGFGSAEFRVFARTERAKLQRLKPHSFSGVFVVAEATTHKHSRVATKYSRVTTQTLRSVWFSAAAEIKSRQAEQAAEKVE